MVVVYKLYNNILNANVHYFFTVASSVIAKGNLKNLVRLVAEHPHSSFHKQAHCIVDLITR